MEKNKEYRLGIAKRLRELRIENHWSQSKLAQLLEVSQPRLSRIESGENSLTAEQFLRILTEFNVPVSYFVGHGDVDSQLQNALARYGAGHLFENNKVVPTKEYENLHELITQVLVSADSPRQITGIAPVLVNNHQGVSLSLLKRKFSELGYRNRLNWLLENILGALRTVTKDELSRWRRVRNNKAEQKLALYLEHQTPEKVGGQDGENRTTEDILDQDVGSKRTLRNLKEERSESSDKWGILTTIQEEDFVQALRAAREIQ